MRYDSETNTWRDITADDAVEARRLALAIAAGEVPVLPSWAEDYIRQTTPSGSNRLLVISTVLLQSILLGLLRMHTEGWTRFHAGEWVTGWRGLGEGRYPVCAVGDASWSGEVVLYRLPGEEVQAATPWSGYVWNQPLPKLERV